MFNRELKRGRVTTSGKHCNFHCEAVDASAAIGQGQSARGSPIGKKISRSISWTVRTGQGGRLFIDQSTPSCQPNCG